MSSAPPVPIDLAVDLVAAPAASAGGAAADAEPTLVLRPVTARELYAQPDPPQDGQLVGPLLVRGARTIVGGHTGEGKTSFALALIRAAVHGGEFLDFAGTEGGRALVIDLEQGLRSVKRALAAADLQDSDRVDYVRRPDGLALDSSPSHAGAVKRLLDGGQYSVVLLDPYYKAHVGDSANERDVVDLMRLLDHWRTEHGFALLLPAHLRKPPAQDTGTRKIAVHDLAGSAGLAQGAETIVAIQRVRDGYAHLYLLKDRDGDLPVGERWGLLYDRKTGFRRDPNAGRERDLGTEVADALGAGWRTAREIAVSREKGGIGANVAAVKAVLEAMVAEARAVREEGPEGRHPTAVCYRAKCESAAPDSPDSRCDVMSSQGGVNRVHPLKGVVHPIHTPDLNRRAGSPDPAELLEIIATAPLGELRRRFDEGG